MGKVFVTKAREPQPEEVEEVPALAEVPFPGEYFFLYPGIVRLRETTGELIDPQKNAFFAGPHLVVLEEFGHEWSERAKAQPESWEQQVGIQYPSREVDSETTSRERLAAEHRLIAMMPWKEYVRAGGLVSYGPDLGALWRRAVTYVDRILRGTTPNELPIEQPTKFELVLNMKTAKAIGLTLPPGLLLRADQVLE